MPDLIDSSGAGAYWLVTHLLAGANAFLSGEKSAVETAHALSNWDFRNRIAEIDEILSALKDIDDQIETAPGVDPTRWGGQFLKQRVREEAFFKAGVTDACRELVAVLTPLRAQMESKRNEF